MSSSNGVETQIQSSGNEDASARGQPSISQEQYHQLMYLPQQTNLLASSSNPTVSPSSNIISLLLLLIMLFQVLFLVFHVL